MTIFVFFETLSHVALLGLLVVVVLVFFGRFGLTVGSWFIFFILVERLVSVQSLVESPFLLWYHAR